MIYRVILLFVIICLPVWAQQINVYNNFTVKDGSIKKLKSITPWNSQQGLDNLSSSNYKQDFYHLAHLYQPQINPLYCGIASSAIILNALNIGSKDMINSVNHAIKPMKYGGGKIDFYFYTQNDILNNYTDKVKNKNIINFKEENRQKKYDPGLSLNHLANILKIHGVSSKLYYADNLKKIKKFRNNLKQYLNKKTHYIIANFNGRILGAKTGGHISPIVAYNKETEQILILDVAAHKNSWYWVDIEDFYKAMHSKDGDKYRGYLIVSQGK
jgi:hypothetical protein